MRFANVVAVAVDVLGQRKRLAYRPTVVFQETAVLSFTSGQGELET